MITITTVALRPLAAETGAGVGGWSHRTEQRRGVLLQLGSSSGHRGWGEASPLPNYSPDQLDAVTQCLAELPLRGATLPTDPHALFPSISKLSDLIPRSLPSARFALETALLDLVAHATNVPAHGTVLGGLTPPHSERVPETLPLSYLLAAGSDESLARQVAHAQVQGFETFKLKLEPHLSLDEVRALLHRLRALLGPQARLRLDVNQGWSLAQAKQFLPALVPFALEFIEEPVRTQDRAELEASPVPLAWDESLLGAVELERQPSAVVALILKPALHGLLGALSLALEARRRRLSVIITHTFDGPVAHAAAAVLALAVGSPERAHGLAQQPGWGLLPGAVVLGLEGGWLAPVRRVGLPVEGVEPC